MSTVIQVEKLSKTYRLGAIGGGTLRDDVSRWLAKLRGKSDPTLKVGQEHHARLMGQEFKALQNVSFEVQQGEVLGVIGRNGAGKSTLLKILSRVTAPTSGEVRVKGRIASLLEVGTGFHPELSGRENIFLNGAILGMSKAEIRNKFDEIVDFSGVADFIDTPVKRYSSGMYVRLAFAVAAHLEPEILIVDEVLAVGDAEFQKKCMGKMQDVSKAGRTILFVSHNMAAVSKLCNRSIMLDGGEVRFSGQTEQVLQQYLRVGTQSDGIRIWNSVNSSCDPRFRVYSMRILSSDRTVTGHVDIRHPFTIEIDYAVLETMPAFRFGLQFSTSDGTIVLTSSNSMHPSFELKPCSPGNYTASCVVPGCLLNEEFYSIRLSVDIPFQKILFIEEAALGFSVEQTNDLLARFPEKWPGVVCPHFEWETRPKDQKDA